MASGLRTSGPVFCRHPAACPSRPGTARNVRPALSSGRLAYSARPHRVLGRAVDDFSEALPTETVEEGCSDLEDADAASPRLLGFTFQDVRGEVAVERAQIGWQRRAQA